MQLFANINYLAVLVAAVAGWILGAVWYGTFSKAWIAAQGKTMESIKQEQAAKVGQLSAILPFLLVFVANLIIAVMLYGIMRHVGPFTIRSGVISGALCWFGFIATTVTVSSSSCGFAAQKETSNAGSSGRRGAAGSRP